MENEILKVQCKELNDSINEIKAKDINLTTSQLTIHNDLIAQNLTTSPTIYDALSVPFCDTKSQMNPNLSKPSILGKPVFKTGRNHLNLTQPNAFISERLKFSKARFVSQVDKKRVLINSVDSKLKTHKSNGLKPEMPLRHRPRKLDNQTIHHKNVSMHVIPHRLRSSYIWVPTGRMFIMNGNK